MLLPTPAISPTPRQRDLIRVAASLFAERGYHAVGVIDIGKELGVTGPAVYRHYSSKKTLLVAVLDAMMTRHLQEVGDLAAADGSPRMILEAIVRHHIEFVCDQGDSIITWRSEARTLPNTDRSRLSYLEDLYVEGWVRTLRRLRPEVSADQARSMCRATIALVESPTSASSALPTEQLRSVLQDMALQALLGTAISRPD